MRAEEVPYGYLVRGPGQTLLGRDERGLYALSSLCAHNHCDLLSVGMVSERQASCAGATARGTASTERASRAPRSSISITSS